MRPASVSWRIVFGCCHAGRTLLLSARGIQHKDVRGLSTAAKFLFDTADGIAPSRQRLEKDQRWRAQEQELRALLSRQQPARSRQ